MVSRARMCLNKVSFRSKGKAEEVAAVHNQRVYECPICFCWHCTSKENWRDEYVDAGEHKKQMAELERKLRTEFNERLKIKNSEITELKRINKNLRRGWDEPEQYQDNKEKTNG